MLVRPGLVSARRFRPSQPASQSSPGAEPWVSCLDGKQKCSHSWSCSGLTHVLLFSSSFRSYFHSGTVTRKRSFMNPALVPWGEGFESTYSNGSSSDMWMKFIQMKRSSSVASATEIVAKRKMNWWPVKFQVFELLQEFLWTGLELWLSAAVVGLPPPVTVASQQWYWEFHTGARVQKPQESTFII